MKKITINFDQWTKLKFELHSKQEIIFYFREREIWWASLGVNIGFEQDGKNDNFERPVLVIKKFNKDMLWCLPLTSKNKVGKYYYQFEYRNRKYSVILSQIRTISSKRLLRKIRTFPKNDFEVVLNKVKNFL